MTNFAITINNSLNLFGPQDTNKWGAMVWGDNWAYSSVDLPVTVTKFLDNTMTLTGLVEIQKETVLLINNTLSLLVDMSDERITDQNGFARLFGDAENAENRALTGYTIVADQASAYTSVPRSTTSYTTQ
jgi:hypothetical protein